MRFQWHGLVVQWIFKRLLFCFVALLFSLKAEGGEGGDKRVVCPSSVGIRAAQSLC